jgi:DNA-3-methyladenine glycosylase
VARELPGKFLVRRSGRTFLAVRIVEVEAYLGARDPASHAFRGRTNRNDVMFREGGHMYVYFAYGMHFCCNVVTGEEGKGMAILIRAGEPVAGLRLMKLRRGTSVPTLLCSGPARLCQALGIGRRENGTDLCGDEIWITGKYDAAGAGKPRGGKRKSLSPGAGGSGGAGGADPLRRGPNGELLRLGRSTRVGIRKGTSHRWRFFVKGNPHVSKGRPSGPDGGKSLR